MEEYNFFALAAVRFCRNRLLSFRGVARAGPSLKEKERT
jgi:hypothetical protein